MFCLMLDKAVLPENDITITIFKNAVSVHEQQSNTLSVQKILSFFKALSKMKARIDIAIIAAQHVTKFFIHIFPITLMQVCPCIVYFKQSLKFEQEFLTIFCMMIGGIKQRPIYTHCFS